VDCFKGVERESVGTVSIGTGIVDWLLEGNYSSQLLAFYNLYVDCTMVFTSETQ
jgi:hypothetical protein